MGDSESERCRSVKLDNTGYVIFVDSDRAIVFEIVGTDDLEDDSTVRVDEDHGSTTSAAASSTTAERD